MKDKIQNLLKQVPAEIIFIAAAFLLSLLAFSFIVHKAVYGHEEAFDQAVSAFFAAHSSAGFIAGMKIITFFGSTIFLFPAYIVLILRYITLKNYQACHEFHYWLKYHKFNFNFNLTDLLDNISFQLSIIPTP